MVEVGAVEGGGDVQQGLRCGNTQRTGHAFVSSPRASPLPLVTDVVCLTRTCHVSTWLTLTLRTSSGRTSMTGTSPASGTLAMAPLYRLLVANTLRAARNGKKKRGQVEFCSVS